MSVDTMRKLLVRPTVWRDDRGEPLPVALPWALWPLCAVGVVGPVVLLVHAIKLLVLG